MKKNYSFANLHKPVSKIFLSAVLFAILSCIVIVSCKKNNNSAGASKQINQADFDKIGVMHNAGVDSIYYVLKSLQDKNQLASLNKSQLVSLMNSGLLKSGNATVQKAIYAASSDRVKISSMRSGYKLNSTDASSMTLYTDSAARVLTSGQKASLGQLAAILGNKNLNFKSTLIAIKNLEDDAKNNLTVDELPVVLSAASLAKSTMQYWHDNLAKWALLFNKKLAPKSGRLKTTGLKTASLEDGNYTGDDTWDDSPDGNFYDGNGDAFNWRQVGASDVAGAVSAAVVTHWMNVVAGYGQAAFGSAIAAGAVSTSVGNAVYQLLS